MKEDNLVQATSEQPAPAIGHPGIWSARHTDAHFRLRGCPIYRGFIARNYGPARRSSIRRQSQMYWIMTSRRFMIWLELSVRRAERSIASARMEEAHGTLIVVHKP